MNIPEISNGIKQNVRSENIARTKIDEKHSSDLGALTTDINANSKQIGKSGESSELNSFDRKALDSIVKDAQEHLEQHNINLKFNILEEGETVQVEIVDSDGKTIRKIPEDDLIKLSESLKSLERGFLDKIS